MSIITDPIYLITGEPSNNEKEFLNYLENSLKNGIKLVQIRAKLLPKNTYKKLATAAIELCHQYQAKVLLNSHIGLVEELNADGIHLPSIDLMRLQKRPLTSSHIISAACHTKEQALQAANLKINLAVICPIFATPSSPKGNPLGWEKFSALAKLLKIPTYALGGLTPQHLEIARSHGATGIAAIRSVWGCIL